MSYAIAAYVVVIGSLFVYGLWIQVQRRRLIRSDPEASRPRLGESGV